MPAVTLGFWFIKVAATTPRGDRWRLGHHVLDLGYLVGAAIFAVPFIALVYGR